MKITFNKLKKIIIESSSSIYDEYEELLCDVFDVDDISEITKEIYKDILSKYERNKLREDKSAALEEATELVHKVAKENGYNFVAHHGTMKNFSEFKYGDIGFHFGTLEQAENAAVRDFDFVSRRQHRKNLVMLNTVLKLHKTLFINDDFNNWDPYKIVEEAIFALSDFINHLNRKDYELLSNLDTTVINNPKLLKRFENLLDNYHFKKDYRSANQLWFLYRDLHFSVKDIVKMDYMQETEIKNIIVKRLKSLGYDSIKYINLHESPKDVKGKDKYSYIVFDANQIKNCEVISFKNGKVVPLEERFNSNTNNLFETN